MNFGLRKYQGKSGIKKLFNLLVEEFGEETAGKRQIALLFALLDSEQPVENIKALMGETDNSYIVRCVCTAVFTAAVCSTPRRESGPLSLFGFGETTTALW